MPLIDTRRCTGCSLCIEECPMNALALSGAKEHGDIHTYAYLKSGRPLHRLRKVRCALPDRGDRNDTSARSRRHRKPRQCPPRVSQNAGKGKEPKALYEMNAAAPPSKSAALTLCCNGCAYMVVYQAKTHNSESGGRASFRSKLWPQGKCLCGAAALEEV